MVNEKFKREVLMQEDPAEKLTKKIPILDIPGLGSYQFYHGNKGTWEFNGTRATLLFDADEKFYELCQRYQKNDSVKVCDFVSVQRQLKAEMMSLKSRKFLRDRE